MRAPRVLNEHGKELWKKLNPSDNHELFVLLCHGYGVFCECEETLAKTGRFIDSPQGVKVHPAVQVQHQAQAQYHRALKALGKSLDQDQFTTLDELLEVR